MEFVLFQEATVLKGIFELASIFQAVTVCSWPRICFSVSRRDVSLPFAMFFDVATPAWVALVIVGRSKLNVG